MVVLAARRANELEQIKAEIEQAGGRALAVPTDISRRDEIDRLVKTTIDALGRIDILINNAGIGGNTALSSGDDVMIERVIAVNLAGPARLTQAALPYMRQQGQGVIVNIGSVAGELATSTLYSATKFGLRGLNDALRRELKQDNIDVVLIAPGFIRTDMTVELKRVPMPGPDIVARMVTEAIRRPRRKIVVPWPYRVLMLIGKLLPDLTDAVIGGKTFQSTYRKRKRVA